MLARPAGNRDSLCARNVWLDAIILSARHDLLIFHLPALSADRRHGDFHAIVPEHIFEFLEREHLVHFHSSVEARQLVEEFVHPPRWLVNIKNPDGFAARRHPGMRDRARKKYTLACGRPELSFRGARADGKQQPQRQVISIYPNNTRTLVQPLKGYVLRSVELQNGLRPVPSWRRSVGMTTGARQ